MKYQEDMMESCKKSPRMRSDHLGTMLILDLEVSPTCLREKGKELLAINVRFGGGRERDTPYKSYLADPTSLRRRGPSATLGRTVRR